MVRQFTVVKEGNRYENIVHKFDVPYTKWRVKVYFTETVSKVIDVVLVEGLDGEKGRKAFESESNINKLEQLNKTLQGDY